MGWRPLQECSGCSPGSAVLGFITVIGFDAHGGSTQFGLNPTEGEHIYIYIYMEYEKESILMQWIDWGPWPSAAAPSAVNKIRTCYVSTRIHQMSM